VLRMKTVEELSEIQSLFARNAQLEVTLRQELTKKQAEIEANQRLLDQVNTQLANLKDELRVQTELQVTHEQHDLEQFKSVNLKISQLQEMLSIKEENEKKLQNSLNELENSKLQLSEQLEKNQAEIKVLQSKESELVRLQTSDSVKAIELASLLEKKILEVQTLTKTAEISKSEIHDLNKQMAKNKEVADSVTKSLQEQVKQLLDQINSLDKKVRYEMEEKFKKERTDLEEKFKRERLELDDKNKKAIIDSELRNTRERVELEEKFKKDKAKLIQDYDKLKKDTDQSRQELQKKMDQSLAAKNEEMNKYHSKIKSLEGELSQIKIQNDSLSAKVLVLEKDSGQAKDQQLAVQHLSEELNALQAKYDLLLQENEVAQTNFQRNIKTLTEKEDNMKKLKNLKEELAKNEENLKRNVQRLEKEKEQMNLDLLKVKDEMETLHNDTKYSLDQAQQKIIELEREKERLKDEIDSTHKKYTEVENEISLTGKKAAQMVKDLQKQIQKQRRGEEQAQERSSSTASDTHLLQENEALIKRAQYVEEELKQADDRFKRMSEEMEQKSKLVQQYILREYEMALQPDAAPKSGKVIDVNS
jgi:chromosome segregation ATPase